MIWVQQNSSNIIIGTIFFVAGIFSSMLLSHVFRIKKQLTIQFENVEIVRKNEQFPEGLSIDYLGRSVDYLSIATYFIWNSGNTTILKDSIAIKDQLRCDADASIFLPKVINPGRIACGIDIKPKSNMAEISFEFLDKNDGFSFSIIHDSQNTPTIKGVLAGTEIKTCKGKTFQNTKKKSTVVVQLAALFLQLTMCIAAIFFLIYSGSIILFVPASAVIVLFILSCCNFFKNQTIMHTPPKGIQNEKNRT